MKGRAIAILVFASLVCAGFAAPAFAQSAQAEAQYQRYLNAHPVMRGELRANPELVNDRGWMSRHQWFVGWLNQHPNMRNQAFGMGAYDIDHHRYNPDCGRVNHVQWMLDHTPDCVR